MEQQDHVPSKVVLLGLAGTLATQLEHIVSEQGGEVCLVPSLPAFESLGPLRQVHADLVFCTAKPEQYLPLLQIIKREKLGLLVVVVSQLPEVPEWIQALENGASDYCAPPFESSYIRWILESSLRKRSVD